MREIKFSYIFQHESTWMMMDQLFTMEEIEWWDFINQIKEKFPRWYLIARRQYTWLKDKNLKEIYFWDILATSNQDKDYDIWEKEDYWYTVVEENIYELWIFYSKWHMTYDVESIYHFRFCEVIWNIYENPELLWNQSK